MYSNLISVKDYGTGVLVLILLLLSSFGSLPKIN